MPGKEGRKWSERKSEQCETLQSFFPSFPIHPLPLVPQFWTLLLERSSQKRFLCL